MNNEISELKLSMDGWVKDIQGELEIFREMPQIIQEHEENIDHNYQLIQEMRTEIRRLKEELNALRMLQLISIKNELVQKKEIKN